MQLGRSDRDVANAPPIGELDVDRKWIGITNRRVRLLSHDKMVVDLEYR